MEESIFGLRQTLASFCNGLESGCDALNQSLRRRATPLDSASATFMQSFTRRVPSLSGEINLLETMSFGTVSFEELLGHCDQVYKKNQADLDVLTDRLRVLGCDLSSLFEDDVVQPDDVSLSTVDDTTLELSESYHGSFLRDLEDDSLFGELASLANLGLSDACLATIASKDDGEIHELGFNLHVPRSHYENGPHCCQEQHQNSNNIWGDTGEVDGLKVVENSMSMECVSEEDYKKLPSYMKSLVSWEDLQIAVEKINSSIEKKSSTTEEGCFHPDELESMGLGHKGRSYLLMLVQMKKLVVETKDGLISYRIA